jgi:hypothetical protein
MSRALNHSYIDATMAAIVSSMNAVAPCPSDSATRAHPLGIAATRDGARVVRMSDISTEAELPRVLELERELQTPACRSNPVRLRELLAPDFTEVGASGRVWDLPGALELLSSEVGNDEETQVIDLTGRVLADGIIVVGWDCFFGGRRTRRTSVWRRDQEGWRQVHHQGTVLAS